MQVIVRSGMYRVVLVVIRRQMTTGPGLGESMPSVEVGVDCNP